MATLIVQSLLDTITCLLIAGLAATYCKRLALPAGLRAALWPNLIVHSAMILSDSLFLMLFSAMLLACSVASAVGCSILSRSTSANRGASVAQTPSHAIDPVDVRIAAYESALDRDRERIKHLISQPAPVPAEGEDVHAADATRAVARHMTNLQSELAAVRAQSAAAATADGSSASPGQ